MDENLTDGGEGARSNRPGLVRTTSSSSIPQIKRWIRTPKAIIMHLTNGTIQVRSQLWFTVSEWNEWPPATRSTCFTVL